MFCSSIDNTYCPLARKQSGSMVHVKGLNDMGRFKPLACGVTRFITKSYVQVASNGSRVEL